MVAYINGENFSLFIGVYTVRVYTPLLVYEAEFNCLGRELSLFVNFNIPAPFVA